jgi:predicted Rossmann fold nucleotide-binding protein DprA/Smf involved in DNA uptake
LDNDLVYKIALTQIAGIGPVNAKSLIAYAGSVKGVFKLSKTQLEKIPGIGSILAQNILSFNDFSKAEKEVEFTEKNGIKALFFLDKEYPYRLKKYTRCSHCFIYQRRRKSLSSQEYCGSWNTQNDRIWKAFFGNIYRRG